jgi:hypothetical protein
VAISLSLTEELVTKEASYARLTVKWFEKANGPIPVTLYKKSKYRFYRVFASIIDTWEVIKVPSL